MMVRHVLGGERLPGPFAGSLPPEPFEHLPDALVVGGVGESMVTVGFAETPARMALSVARGAVRHAISETVLATTVNCTFVTGENCAVGAGHLPDTTMVAKPHGWSGTMHEWSTKMLLRHYLDEGLTKTELSRRFGVSRRTIHYWIESGQLDRDLATGHARYWPRAPVASKLDPYKGIIEARLQEFPKLSAQRKRLVPMGFGPCLPRPISAAPR